ncbi:MULTISPECIES: hypothetical protein [Methylomonas]|uniref:Uncharacterized protein n=2 Tax=Methylomonas TaxID=416 RepID=A0A126T7W4_9GAMM|nr:MULTISPECIES: hypothetical protein [Methylomonas]AMK78130.1 hypothetical protein JT25_016850 [Methylomonas denitrificans]OAH96475.1 hypothetical protein A1342_02995 [Methylomonas methanica]TCV85665.1 hypothetical protein EDE11_105227 [Methylomonas methanica]
MFSKPPLLTVQQGSKGTFVSWLEELGLNEFLKNYSLPKLIEWRWLEPQYRVIFPVDYFLAWRNFPYCPAEIDPEKPGFDAEDDLWQSDWRIDNDQETLWFIHPFFRAEHHCYNLLRQNTRVTTLIPEAFIHPFRHIEIIPYVDYFFHWQAYALIDVIRFADCFPVVLDSPNVEEISRFVIKVSEKHKEQKIKASDILNMPNSWGDFAEPLTWVSHYRLFKDALLGHENEFLLEKGARQLADYLGINEEILEDAIEFKLLKLAQVWLSANKSYCKWTLRAWPYLQKDIRLALEWLYMLNGKSLAHYLDKWDYSSFGEREWSDLVKVLPYHFFEDKQCFLRYIPLYEIYFEGLLPSGKALKQLVDDLQVSNYSFGSFLHAFRLLHESLNYMPEQKGGIDFRNPHPLDYYSLLAIRTESCFYDALNSDSLLSCISDPKLSSYILELAKQKTYL